ncbi:MAG TPA: hypothetical protein VMT50_03090, partial [Steroidobacteraceae bacterium]|nr:hypothetical protein [Steroidobacteraceae bacterium]
RYYHQSVVNQSLHFVSAISFLCAYALLPFAPGASGLIGWLVSMGTRQSGHFFFEPRGYDSVNETTYEHKESIKVGYNMRRKAVLIAIWVASPLLLVWNPTLFGVLPRHTSTLQFWNHVGLLWLTLGGIGLLFRTLHLFYLRDVQTGLVWCTKILTDPINDIRLYHKAPLNLLRGERASLEAAPH